MKVDIHTSPEDTGTLLLERTADTVKLHCGSAPYVQQINVFILSQILMTPTLSTCVNSRYSGNKRVSRLPSSLIFKELRYRWFGLAFNLLSLLICLLPPFICQLMKVTPFLWT